MLIRRNMLHLVKSDLKYLILIGQDSFVDKYFCITTQNLVGYIDMSCNRVQQCPSTFLKNYNPMKLCEQNN